jgi:hypothetical protein
MAMSLSFGTMSVWIGRAGTPFWEKFNVVIGA